MTLHCSLQLIGWFAFGENCFERQLVSPEEEPPDKSRSDFERAILSFLKKKVFWEELLRQPPPNFGIDRRIFYLDGDLICGNCSRWHVWPVKPPNQWNLGEDCLHPIRVDIVSPWQSPHSWPLNLFSQCFSNSIERHLWKTVRLAGCCSAKAGTTWTAEAPVPMTAILFPFATKSFLHSLVWKDVPEKSPSPGMSGNLGSENSKYLEWKQ